MKSSRANLPKLVAIPPSFNAFFSFPIRKSGYSGVATYIRTSITPCKAEEGLNGILQPKPPLTAEERVSTTEAYPQRVISDEDEGKDEEEAAQLDYKDLDSEGRVIMVDLGLFVLINVYCPNDGNGTEERDKYKADFHRVLEARVKGLVERERREVVVVGDLNACAAVIDHCEGHLMVARGHAEGMEGEDGFWGKDVRRWLRDWMVNDEGTGGCMVDVVRKLWPDRKGMYTCWNTKISARDSNYGTRIDFILITKGILPWVKGANIQPEIKGSDHCPVYLDLHDEIIDANGQPLKLRDFMGTANGEVPRLASKHWDEHSGKQTSLQSFFGRKNSEQKTPLATPPSEEATKPAEQQTILTSPIPEVLTPVPPASDAVHHAIAPTVPTEVPPSSTPPASLSQPPPTQSPSPVPPKPTPTLPNINAEASTSKPTKRKLTADTLTRRKSSAKKQKPHNPPEKPPAQTKLSTFFAKPKPPPSPSPPPPTLALTSRQRSKSKAAECGEDPVEVDLEADHDLAVLLSQESEAEPHSSQRSAADTAESKHAWSSLLAPVQAPKCTVHGEPAKEMTVAKPGPNKGKRFFICARPVGPGYDKGRAERLREHVDPTWKCDFFKWSSEARRDMRK